MSGRYVHYVRACVSVYWQLSTRVDCSEQQQSPYSEEPPTSEGKLFIMTTILVGIATAICSKRKQKSNKGSINLHHAVCELKGYVYTEYNNGN